MPHRNPLFGSGPDPETRFDHWLDGFVTGTPVDDASHFDDPTGQLTRAQSGARQFHDLAARPVTVPGVLPARQRIEERMMHSGTLAAPATGRSGMNRIPSRRHRNSVPWWSLNSPVIAAALIIAVLVSLSGALYWVQRPPATPEPADSPGFAQSSTGATPEGGSLSCSAPGYRPVVMDDAADNDLAMIGETEEPIVFGDDSTIIPLSDGSSTTLHGNISPMHNVPGAYISFDPETGDSTVTNALTDESWEFPALDLEGIMPSVSPGTFAFVEAGPYVVGPTDSQGLDWRILDVRTGESILTSDLLDGAFPWMVVPNASHLGDQDSGIQAIQFSRMATSISGIENERLATGDTRVAERALHDDLAVVLPGSVEQAAVFDLGDLLGEQSWGGSTTFVLSNDESHIAWRGWIDDEAGEGFFTFFVADVDDLANERPTIRFADPWGHEPLAFSPDGSVLYVLTGNSIQAVHANPLEGNGVEQLAVIGQDPLNILSINDDAGTIIYAGEGGFGPETWMLDTATSERTRLPELDGYSRHWLVDDAGQRMVVTSQHALGATRVDGEAATYLVIDTATGAIIDQQPYEVYRAADGGPNATLNVADAASGFVVFIDRAGDTGDVLVVDANTGDQWNQALPNGISNGEAAFTISPSGGCLLLNTFASPDVTTTASYLTPLEPDATWTKLDAEIVDWWAVPTDSSSESLPAQDILTPVTLPEAFEPDFQTRPDVNIILYAQPAPVGIASLLPLDAPLMALDDPKAPDTPLTQTDDEGQTWVNVRTADGRTGWVREVDLVPVDQHMDSEQESPTPEATPTASALSQVIPDNLVPVIETEPWGMLDRSEAGGLGESGLTIPLRNGETFHDPAGVGVSQVVHTDVAIVEHADGIRIAIDLDTGETLATLYPKAEQERLIGMYQLTPANDEMTNWRILDLRTGESTTTAEIDNGNFDRSVAVRGVSLSIETPGNAVAQFVIPDETAEPVPWQGRSTDEGPVSGTLVLPGDLDHARFIEGSIGSVDFRHPTVTISAGDTPLVAYVTAVTNERVRLENASTGEVVAVWDTFPRQASASEVYLPGLTPDNELLVWWTTGGGEGLDTVSVATWANGAPAVEVLDYRDGRINQVLVAETSLLVTTAAPSDSGSTMTSWLHLDVATGDVRELPELDGYLPNRYLPTTPWVVLQSGGGPNMSTVIVDKRTGEIAAHLDDPDLGTSTALSPSHDFSVIVITGHTGDEATTGYVLDAERGDAWQITPPEIDLSQSANIWYHVSPDGSLLVATNASGPGAGEADPGETWISPVQPEPQWTSIGTRTIESWLYDPEGNP